MQDYCHVSISHNGFFHQNCTDFKPQLKGYEAHLKSLILHTISPLKNCYKLICVERKSTAKLTFHRNPERYCAHYRAEL